MNPFVDCRNWLGVKKGHVCVPPAGLPLWVIIRCGHVNSLNRRGFCIRGARLLDALCSQDTMMEICVGGHWGSLGQLQGAELARLRRDTAPGLCVSCAICRS